MEGRGEGSAQRRLQAGLSAAGGGGRGAVRQVRNGSRSRELVLYWHSAAVRSVKRMAILAPGTQVCPLPPRRGRAAVRQCAG